MSIVYLPSSAWDTSGSAPCLRDSTSEVTYGQLKDLAQRFAPVLSARGVVPGDVVAVMLPNSVEFVIALFAAWLLGASVTPINPTFTANEFDYQVTNSHARVLVGIKPHDSSVSIPEVSVTGSLSDTQSPASWDSINERDIALIIYTSGSTGRPKGVLLDHGNLNAMVSMIAKQNELTPADHCLLILPLFHVNSICASLLASLSVGAQVTLLERFDPEVFIRTVNEKKPTYFSAVPAILARLAETPADKEFNTETLRFALCGAAPISVELLNKCETRFGIAILEGYGLTEGTCASAANPLRGERKIGTVGTVFPGQTLIVADENDKPVPVGERGEVLIAGPTIMRGYLGNPEATQTTIRNGWLHTGDVGVMDADGYLSIVDRIKDMIIRGGENIYPKEIEAFLATHPSVLESAVVGIPDQTYGELPYAQVVLDPHAPLVSDEELLTHCRAGLTKIKVPVTIEIVRELPRNPVGKIDKPGLRRLLAERNS